MRSSRPSILCVVLAVVLAGSRSARGETPVYVFVGAGVAQGRVQEGGQTDTRLGPGLHVDVGYRLRRRVGVGLHLGVSRAGYDELRNLAMFDERNTYSFLPIELGVTAQLGVTERLWLAPWIGFQDRVERERCSTTFFPSRPTVMGCTSHWDYQARHQVAFGLTAMADLSMDRKHRFTAFASLTRGAATHDDELGDSPPYTGLWLGVGYRYW